MFLRIRNTLKRSDYFLLLLLVALVMISFFVIYSSKYDTVMETVSVHPYKQLRVIIAGIAAFFIIPMIDYKAIMRFAVPLYILGLLLLCAVLFGGSVEKGAQRWLIIGPFKGQPSEFLKIIWVIMLARIFSDIDGNIMSLVKILQKSLWVLPPFVLIYLQPDLGTSLSFLAVWGIIVAFLGLRWKVVMIIAICAAVSLPVMWGHMKDFQRKRVIAFINPEKYSDSDGYQAIQSKIAIGSGGITGKGYLKGTQSHLKFMPERHTDFIFAVANEEFGFFGGTVIVCIFFMMIVRIIGIASNCKEAQGKIMCIAVAAFIFFQFYVNIGMTIGIMPVVGITLPFISYGGSSLITFMIMIGLVNSVYVSRNGINV